MKLKDLRGFPKKKENLPEGKGYYRLRGVLYNNVLLEIGEIELVVDEDKIKELFYKMDVLTVQVWQNEEDVVENVIEELNKADIIKVKK